MSVLWIVVRRSAAAWAALPLWAHTSDLALAGLRNLTGLTGMTLATATFAGPTRGWVTAFPYVLLVLLLGTHGSSTGGRSEHPWWAFVLEPSTSIVAAASAALLMSAAATAHVRFGSRAEQ